MTDKEELEQRLQHVKTSALYASGAARDELRREQVIVERKLVLLDRLESSAKSVLGQTKWTRPWMRGRVTSA